MYCNLERTIRENNMTVNSAALAIGITDKTMRYKINNETFDVAEAFKIHEMLFPKYDLHYLFKSDNATQSAN